MADEPSTIPAETKPGSTPQAPADATGTNGGNAGRTFTQAELDAAIKERLDRAERKHKEAQEAATKAAQEKAAQEQGKWQELYESAKPLAEKAERYQKRFAALLEAEMEAIPERLRVLIPAGEPDEVYDWILKAKAAGILAKPQAPATDAASGTGDGRANNAVAARQSELDLWQRMGLNNAVRAATQNNKR